MSNISLTDVESSAFYDVIYSELKCVINEWDDDTCRVPSKKRLKDGKYAKSIIEKWDKTQKKIPNTDYVNLDNIIACNIDLTKEETAYAKRLLDKTVSDGTKELSKYPKPYTGVLAMIDNLVNNANAIAARM